MNNRDLIRFLLAHPRDGKVKILLPIEDENDEDKEEIYEIYGCVGVGKDISILIMEEGKGD
jgi:hypothetical protein